MRFLIMVLSGLALVFLTFGCNSSEPQPAAIISYQSRSIKSGYKYSKGVFTPFIESSRSANNLIEPFGLPFIGELQLRGSKIDFLYEGGPRSGKGYMHFLFPGSTYSMAYEMSSVLKVTYSGFMVWKKADLSSDTTCLRNAVLLLASIDSGYSLSKTTCSPGEPTLKIDVGKYVYTDTNVVMEYQKSFKLLADTVLVFEEYRRENTLATQKSIFAGTSIEAMQRDVEQDPERNKYDSIRFYRTSHCFIKK